MKYVIIRNDTDELYHHGVKGMKWGRRKAQYTSSTSSKFSTGHNKIASMLGNNGKKQVSDNYKRVQITKSNYKQAKKDFNKSYNNAYRYSQAHLIGQYTNKKKKEESDRKWGDTYDKAVALNKTQKTYKTAKKENKQKIKETYKNLNKQASTKDKIIYNNATRKKAAKYIVNNNMTVKEATAKSKKDAWRNTAVIMGAYGGLSVAALYKMNH